MNAFFLHFYDCLISSFNQMKPKKNTYGIHKWSRERTSKPTQMRCIDSLADNIWINLHNRIIEHCILYGRPHTAKWQFQAVLWPLQWNSYTTILNSYPINIKCNYYSQSLLFNDDEIQWHEAVLMCELNFWLWSRQ